MSAPSDRTGEPVPDPIFEPSAADEVTDELAFHLEMRTRELIARGLAPELARRAARDRFADLDRVSAECHQLAQRREDQVKRMRYATNLVQDIHFALRMLRQRVGFALMAILPLALGIGGATAMYSVVDGVMLRPLPFVHPERLVAIWATEEKWRNEAANAIAWNRVVIGQADYTALHEQAHTLSGVAVWGRDAGMLVDPSGASFSLPGVRVSSSIFDLLGIHAFLGRGIRAGEDVTNGPHVVLLSWETWQQHFKGDSSLVGRSVTIDDKPYTVVGIVPPGVRLDRSAPPPAIWYPAFQSKQDLPAQHNRSYAGVARLAPGATMAQANAEVGRIIGDVKTSWKGSPDGTSGRVVNWQDDQVGTLRGSLLILAGAVGLLLLIACVNVATLMFGEAARRQPEIAARTALGATPGRLARQLLTESLVIAGCSAVTGAAFGWALTRALVAMAPPKIPGLADVRFDGRVLLFTIGCAIVVGIAFGILPAFALLRWGRQSAARGGGGQTAKNEHRIQRGLVAVEVGLSLVMLVGCSLLGRSLVRLASVDPGFTPNGLLIVELTPPLRVLVDSAATVHYTEAARRELRAIPGVAAVSGSNAGVFNGGTSSSPLKIPGRGPEDVGRPIQQRVVLADYFRTMRVPIIAGRDFNDADNSSAERVAIISAAEVRRDFPTENPLGRRVTWQGTDWTVVGVAADVHYTKLAAEFQATIYIPEPQWSGNWISWLVRADGAGDGTAVIRAIRERLKTVDAAVSVRSIDPVPTLVEQSYSEERYRTLLGSLFGIIGSVLAAVGMFGVISRTVARRMREAGIRVALGAQGASVTRLMLRETLIGAAIGATLGIPAALWLARVLQPYLFGIHSFDPVAYGLALGLLVIATATATVPPARRAARVDPVTVLRAD